MQIITRRRSESIVIEGQTTVTVVDVCHDEVTLDITGPDGDTERVTLLCRPESGEIRGTALKKLVPC